MVAMLCLMCGIGGTMEDRYESLAKTCVAVIMVESGGNADAVGDGGLAVGLLQIHPVMVWDVNRISGRHYVLADRYDLTASVEMFCLYCLHYWPNGTPEQWARGWNSGPDGPEQDCTLGYWQRVLAASRKVADAWNKRD